MSMKNIGSVFAAGQKLLSVLAAENRVRRSGGSDNDVGAVAGGVEILELDGLSVELLREADGALVGSVGDKDGSAAVGHQVAGSELAHLAGANDEDRLPFQSPKDFFSQLNRDGRNRH